MVLLPRMHPATSHTYLRHLMEQSCTTSERCGGEVVVAEGATEDQKQCDEGLAARPNPFWWRPSLSHIQPYHTFHAADIFTSSFSLCQTFSVYTSSCIIYRLLQTQSSNLCDEPLAGWFPSHYPSFHPQPCRLQALDFRLLRTLQDQIAQIEKSDQDSESLQLQAIERARESFARLPKDHAIFIQCLQGNETISDVLTAVSRRHQSYSRKKSSRALQNFQQYTTWLRSMSDAVDIVVQTQAGIGCPLWAPIKFVLKVGNLFTSVILFH